jgi:hypothetical protein
MKRIKYYMVRLFISSVFVFFVTNLSAQRISMKGDTLLLGDDAKFWLNEEIVFGTGTMPNHEYSYVYEPPSSLQKLVNNRKRKFLSPAYKGSKSRIVKFEKEVGHNKKGYDYSILVLQMPNGSKYWCDVKDAYANHEILLKGEAAQLTDSDVDKDEPTKKKPAPKKTSPKKKPAKVDETIF